MPGLALANPSTGESEGVVFWRGLFESKEKM